ASGALSRFQGTMSKAAVPASAVQYRPGMFACTVQRHHSMRTVLAGEDNKELHKWPKSGLDHRVGHLAEMAGLGNQGLNTVKGWTPQAILPPCAIAVHRRRVAQEGRCGHCLLPDATKQR